MNKRAPIVFLHSSLSSGRQWQALQQLIDLPAITPDLTGYGSRPMPDNDREQHRLALELQALSGELPQQPFHLVGHSYGGATALRLARLQPERILSLTLFEPVAFHLLPANHAQRQAIQTLSNSINQLLDQQQPEQAAACFIDYWNQPGTFDRLPQAMKSQFFRGIVKVGYDFAALLQEPCSPEDLSAIQCPQLLLQGTESPQTTQAVMQILKDALPGAEHQALACGHMGPVSHAGLVNPVVSTFIAAHNKAG